MNKKENFLKKLMKKKEKGITLIALVITIIVLLILAGVTINAITGNESAMEKAQQARSENEQADELDSIKLAIVDAVASSKENDGKVHADELSNALNGLIDGEVSGSAPWTVKGKTTKKEYTITENGQVAEATTITVEVESFEKLNETLKLPSDKNIKARKVEGEDQQQIVIPAGFQMAEDTGTTLESGMVIEDAGTVNGTERQGNQFVWVPVNQTLTFAGGEKGTIPLGRYDTWTGTPSPKQDVSEGYVATTSDDVIKSNYYEFADDADSQKVKNTTYGNTKAKDIEAFVNSANTNGGYYIGRYEAGVKGTKTSDEKTSYTIEDNDGNRTTFAKNSATDNNISKLVIQSGVGVWNMISQPIAAQVCQKMYETETGVTSDLCNSYAWDTAIIFIQQCGNNNAYYNQKGLAKDTSKPGETGTNPLANGTIDKQCNIYDMAGNVMEWTTESYTDSVYPCVDRGGSHNYNYNYTSYRNNLLKTSNIGTYIGFRSILYL